jgi:hypothetical protein
LRKSTKRIIIIISAVVLAAAGYVLYLFLYYFNYKEYRKYLKDYSFEAGREFAALEDDDPKVERMVLAAENDTLKLYTNTTTTEVAVYDKRSGEITYSNPVDRNSDPIASGRNKTALNSQFMLTYYDISMTMITMYNYDFSVEREQFEIEAIDNGIRYTYLLGNLDSPTGLIPPFITEERLQEKILSKLGEREAKTFRGNYIASKTLDGFLELTSGAQANQIGLKRWNGWLEEIGYTQADFDEDAALAAGGSLPERTTFTIVLEYRLEGDSLKVTVPAEQIKETGSGRLAGIDLLCFFGAGSDKEEGYMLVPNGSGSLIRFNNGKKTERYNEYVYGMDDVSQAFTEVENKEKIRIPVFGIKHENSAIFARITEGDALANIVADISGNVNSYNYVYPSFVIRGSEKVYLFGATGASSDLPVLEKDIYALDLTVSYTFLNKEDASYSGMARYYRNKLIEDGVLTVKDESDSIPFYLDILGSIKKQKSIMGAPYLGVYPMTDFEEAWEIAKKFKDEGVSNIRMNYLGWFNGGYYHYVPKNIRVDRKLGGKKGLKELNSKLADNGMMLYGDVALQKISFVAEGKNYSWRMENAQYYSGIAVGYGPVNPATLRKSSLGYRETLNNILSPRFLVRHVGWLTDEIKDVNIGSLSLRDMGDTLTSDKRRTNVINRQESKQVVLGQLERIDEVTDRLMLNGGNSYSWAYADDLQNVPSGHNSLHIVDVEVPFYQMVIHGCIDYSGYAVNLSDSYDRQQTILRMVEFGMYPHFTLSYEETSEMKYTGMNLLYSTQYDVWLEDAVRIYEGVNEALKHVTGSTITEHEAAAPGIRKVTYDNGCIIYINYNDSDADIDAVKIPARSYVIKGVEQ